MRQAATTISLIAASLLAANDLAAQTCLGLPSFSAGKFQAIASAGFTKDVSVIDAGVIAGSSTAFAGVTVGAITYDGFGGTTTAVAVRGGYQIPLDTAGLIQLCPVASAGVGFGRNHVEGIDADASSRHLSFGLAIGTLLRRDSEIGISPTASLRFLFSSVTFERTGGDLTESDTQLGLDLGIGFIFNNRLSLRPSVAIPLGVEGADPVIGFTVAVNFGNAGEQP